MKQSTCLLSLVIVCGLDITWSMAINPLRLLGGNARMDEDGLKMVRNMEKLQTRTEEVLNEQEEQLRYTKRSGEPTNRQAKDFKAFFRHVFHGHGQPPVPQRQVQKEDVSLKDLLRKLRRTYESEEDNSVFEKIDGMESSEDLTGLSEKDSHLCHFKLCGVLQRRKLGIGGKFNTKRTRIGRKR